MYNKYFCSMKHKKGFDLKPLSWRFSLLVNRSAHFLREGYITLINMLSEKKSILFKCPKYDTTKSKNCVVNISTCCHHNIILGNCISTNNMGLFMFHYENVNMTTLKFVDWCVRRSLVSTVKFVNQILKWDS